jgi:hypothetical protein
MPRRLNISYSLPERERKSSLSSLELEHVLECSKKTFRIGEGSSTRFRMVNQGGRKNATPVSEIFTLSDAMQIGRTCEPKWRSWAIFGGR